VVKPPQKMSPEAIAVEQAQKQLSDAMTAATNAMDRLNGRSDPSPTYAELVLAENAINVAIQTLDEAIAAMDASAAAQAERALYASRRGIGIGLKRGNEAIKKVRDKIADYQRRGFWPK
jgi:hypothetical protein